ncbi:hypothetical protein B0G75_103636 [Paraburkholderia sp. BL18I3N2]|nr:hypothetical protein B0G75_103636 [Paraburkholderia sp. BL18I3N2]
MRFAQPPAWAPEDALLFVVPGGFALRAVLYRQRICCFNGSVTMLSPRRGWAILGTLKPGLDATTCRGQVVLCGSAQGQPFRSPGASRSGAKDLDWASAGPRLGIRGVVQRPGAS